MSKKAFILTAALAAVCIASCKKSDDDNTNSGSGNNGTWTLGTTTYTAARVRSSTIFDTYNLLAETSGTGNDLQTLTFVFNDLAQPKPGQYKINNDGGNNTDAVYVLASRYENGEAALYGCLGRDSTKATVSVENGKVIISVPPTWAIRNGGKDSLKLTAMTIREQ